MYVNVEFQTASDYQRAMTGIQYGHILWKYYSVKYMYRVIEA